MCSTIRNETYNTHVELSALQRGNIGFAIGPIVFANKEAQVTTGKSGEHGVTTQLVRFHPLAKPIHGTTSS